MTSFERIEGEGLTFLVFTAYGVDEAKKVAEGLGTYLEKMGISRKRAKSNSDDEKDTCSSKVDSFKRSSEIKSCPQFEVVFPLFYAQNERKLSEFNVAKMVRGMGFEPMQPYGNRS